MGVKTYRGWGQGGVMLLPATLNFVYCSLRADCHVLDGDSVLLSTCHHHHHDDDGCPPHWVWLASTFYAVALVVQSVFLVLERYECRPVLRDARKIDDSLCATFDRRGRDSVAAAAVVVVENDRRLA